MIGQTLSHYRIIKELGKGGMGVVYLAEDTLLGRQVAIKMLREVSRPGTEHDHKRFLREAQNASKLSHPHIATIHDFGETPDGRPYIVMEYVKGKTLGELIQEGRLTLERSLEIITDVAEALNEAHCNGIIHRDVKPSNVAINERGVVKVLDHFPFAAAFLKRKLDDDGKYRLHLEVGGNFATSISNAEMYNLNYLETRLSKSDAKHYVGLRTGVRVGLTPNVSRVGMYVGIKFASSLKGNWKLSALK